MIKEKMYNEIQELRDQGYTEKEVIDLIKVKSGAPSAPTIRKYYREHNNDNLHTKLEKDKVYDVEPYRGVIIEILNSNTNIYISSIYDFLVEQYVDTGMTETLPGNERTLRNYVKYLRGKGLVQLGTTTERVYDFSEATPPGDRMQLDFGQYRVSKELNVHFIAMVLQYSRLICVYAQDHKYNSVETCQAIYRAFCKIGGRVKMLVIDQDTVMVAEETYGEVIKTRTFEDFCQEQELKLYVCEKGDPESKGMVENLVGFIKKNFFSARKSSLTDIYSVVQSLAPWVERKNKRIHQQTYREPLEMFEDTEKEHLRPLLKSVYDKSPSTYTQTTTGNPPSVRFKTNNYVVPREYVNKEVIYKEVSGKLYVYDAISHELIANYEVNPERGKIIRLTEDKKESTESWEKIADRLRLRWNCYDFQHFINGFKKEAIEGSGLRELKKQLKAVEDFLDKETPDRSIVAQVMKECCDNFDYKYTQFVRTYEKVKASGISYPSDNYLRVNNVNLDIDFEIYDTAFKERSSI